ncbi:hypothetical protein GCM10010411_48310 [Actinomadura fulvescens]|uniref:Uncharacterized protein n=1 Tax=Actinomadura fulvescens TaxID=46160 RepID=A0ABN3Q114_9ACTN
MVNRAEVALFATRTLAGTLTPRNPFSRTLTDLLVLQLNVTVPVTDPPPTTVPLDKLNFFNVGRQAAADAPLAGPGTETRAAANAGTTTRTLRFIGFSSAEIVKKDPY